MLLNQTLSNPVQSLFEPSRIRLHGLSRRDSASIICNSPQTRTDAKRLGERIVPVWAQLLELSLHKTHRPTVEGQRPRVSLLPCRSITRFRHLHPQPVSTVSTPHLDPFTTRTRPDSGRPILFLSQARNSLLRRNPLP